MLLALAGATAGCGGEDEVSKEEYEETVASTLAEVEGSIGRLGFELRAIPSGAGSLSDAGDEIDEIREELDEGADELEDVAPPEDAEEAHEQLIGGLRAFSDELEDFQAAVESGDVDRVRDFVQDLEALDTIEQIDEASEELEAKGYRIESG